MSVSQTSPGTASSASANNCNASHALQNNTEVTQEKILGVDDFSKNAILDQLRQNTSLDNEELTKNVSNNMLKQLLVSPQTQEIIVGAMLNETVDALNAKCSQQKISVKQRLSKEDQDRLRKSFCMFNLDFSKATDCLGHPFWRAHRSLSERRMLKQAGIKPGSRPAKGYDVVYKDIGGNPTTHLLRGEIFTHTCAPLLSNNDDKRHSSYKEQLRRFSPRKRSACYNMHIEKNSQVICNRTAQNCCIKAEVLIFLHSAYDMSLVDIADAMHRADARVAYGCLHFNPIVLYESKGKLLNGMCFEKRVVNGRVKIRFWYTNDNQEGYEHDFLNYVALLRTFRIASSAKNKRYYNVQFDTTDDDTCFFVIRQSISGDIPRSRPFRVFTNDALSDKMIVYSWHWDTINPGNISASVLSRMRPQRIIVPRKLFYKMCAFADTLPDSKFTVKNILIAGTSFNTREVISGQSIGVVEPIEPAQLKMLAVCVYVLTYISNYECTKSLSLMIDDETRVREESGNGFFSRLFRIGIRLPWNHRVQKFQQKMGKVMDEIKSFEPQLTDQEDLTTGNIKTVFNAIKEFARVERRFDITLDKMCNFLTVEEELDCLSLDSIPCDRGFTSDSPIAELIDPGMVREAVINSLEEVKVVETLYDESAFVTVNCDSDLKIVENTSNGDCVFQSMIDSGVTHTLEPKQMRMKLLNSNYFRNIKDVTSQRRLLECLDGSTQGYGDLVSFLLFSLEFQQGVCVHANGQNLRFGRAPFKHFLIKDNHCSFLKPTHNFDPIPSYTIAGEASPIHYSTNERDKQFELFFGLREQYSRTQYNKRLLAAKHNYCPLSELGDGNYVCRSGLKTAEMFVRYFHKEYESAVSIGGPGGEVQFLTNKGVRVFGITKTDLIDFSPSIRSHLFSQLIGDTYDGDITKECNIVSFRDAVRRFYPSGVCFYGGDVATAADNTALDCPMLSNLISWEILLSCVVLREGGDAYFKVFDLLSDNMPKNVEFLVSVYEKVEIVKLETSRSASTELHLICTGFKLSNETPIDCYNYLLQDNEIVASPVIMNHLMHAQKLIDLHIMTGLREYRRCFNTAGENNEHVNRFPLEKIEGYRNVLCLPQRISAGGIVEGVKRTFRSIYTMSVVKRDFDSELRNYEYVVERVVPPKPAVISSTPTPIIHRALSAENLLALEIPVAEPVPGLFQSVVKAFVTQKPNFEESTEKDRTFTVMGQTGNTGITNISEPFHTTNVPFSIAPKRVATEPAPVIVTPKVETPKADEPDTCRAAMHEFLELQKLTLSCEVSNHARMLHRISSVPLAATFTAKESGTYTYMSYTSAGEMKFRFGCPIGSRTFNKFFFNGKFHPTRDAGNILTPGDNFLFSEYCEIAIESEMIAACESIDVSKFVLPDGAGIVQAAAGCGKTYFVVKNCVPPHLPGASNVLLSTVEGKEDFIRRMEKEYSVVLTQAQKVHIRTLASFLVNHKRNQKSESLFIDEALMSHPGQLFYAIAMSGATDVKFLGDVLQIPYVNRTPAYTTKYHKLASFVPIVETLYVSYRCPTDVAARLDPYYVDYNSTGIGMKSVKYRANTCKLVRLSNDNFPKEQGVQYLTFTQTEKAKLESLKLKVSTVHEFQGKEAKRIIVVRINPFPQEELYLRFNYALVAITRHTEQLTYYTRVTTDALSKMIKVDGITCHVAVTEDECRRVHHVSAGAADVEVFRIAREMPVATYTTMNVINTSISKISEPRLFFVPKYGKKADCRHKPLVMRKNVVIDSSSGRVNIYVVSSDLQNQKHNLCTITRNLRECSTQLSDRELRRVFVSGSVENDIDRAALGYTLYKQLRARCTLCTTANNYDVPTEVFDLLTKNGLNPLPNASFHSVEISIADYIAHFSVPHIFLPETAQMFVNSFFGPCAYTDQSFDGWDVRNSDLNIEIGEIAFAPVGCVQLPKKFDSMRPILKTPMPLMRDYNTRELMLALEKRNRNVPSMNGVVDIEVSSTEMLESMITEVFDAAKLKFHLATPITISTNSVGEWLSGQPTAVRPMIVPDFALHCLALNSYNFSIKRKPKPNLTVDATSSYLALQTIVYHEKPINALFCSVFREIKKRVTMSLKPHVKIFCDMSAEEFENVLQRDIPPQNISPLVEKLEIDISKYDKSQRELALEFECKLMRYFGVDDDIVELWFNAHVLTEVYDKTTKLRALIPYQRKSGDASTFIGNTLFLMAVICDLIPVSQLDLALFSGDDSLLYGYGLNQYKNAQHFGLKFNLEIKFFTFEHSYFCSKFLLPVQGHWKFTPDPLKFITKLGRHDLVNPLHVEEYRISFVDTVRNYEDYHTCESVALALRERYGVFRDFTSFLASLPDMTSSENFTKLFYSEVGDVLDLTVVFNRDF
uniref:ORF1 n=1 Tax=Castlerea virus TaxID=1969351 RepID=A0A1W5RY19_9VIRU|nr:ORF1 [Castlerea virus]